jgi:hypothetical protein
MAIQMRITWVSGDKAPQQVQYGNGKMQRSEVTTFSQDDMKSELLPFPFPTFMIDSFCHLFLYYSKYYVKDFSSFASWNAENNYYCPCI